MKEKGPEKRRSDRLMITIPLIIEGKDSKGQSFDHTARTITINRHGARITIPHPLRAGQTITVTNLATRKKCRFRVVGPITPATYRGGEWGIECTGLNENIWDIQFPPAPADEKYPSKALLECRDCGTPALMRVSLVEVEVLETSGILTKPCANCERDTPWRLSEKPAAIAELAAKPSPQEEKKASGGGAENRRHRRSALQLPVRVRDFYGGTEVTRTENVSKGGFCFVSEKQYQVGEILLVACPYDPSTAHHIEVRVRVSRCHRVEGSARQIYGIRYER